MNVHYSHEEWRAIFSQRVQSGLSVRKWCERNNFKYDTYKYWEKKIRMLDEEPGTVSSPLPSFVELPIQSCTELSFSDAPAVQIHYHDFHVGIHSHAQMEQVAGVLKLLQSLC